MNTVNKVLKIAGKNREGLVKGVSVTANGVVNTSNGASIQFMKSGELAAGAVESIYAPTNTPSRIFLVNAKTASVPWTLSGFSYAIDAPDADEAQAPLGRVYMRGLNTPDLTMQSNGERELIKGSGERSMAYTGLTPQEATGVRFTLKNNSSSESLSYLILVVGYPASSVVQSQATQKTKVYSKIPETVSKSVTIAPNSTDEVVLYDSSVTTFVEYLEFTSDNKMQPAFYIAPKAKDGTTLPPIGMGNVNTGSGSAITTGNAESEGASLFDVPYSSDKAVKLALNRYMSFPYGVKIYVANFGTNALTTKCNLRGYFVKEVLDEQPY